MNWAESDFLLLGMRLLSLNLVCAVIVEWIFRRNLNKFPGIDRSKYSNAIWSELLDEFRNKKLSEFNNFRKFVHLSVIGFIWLFLTSVVPSYIFFTVIALFSTYFYYRWESFRFAINIESNKRHNVLPDPKLDNALQSLKNNTRYFAFFVFILGCVWFYQTQITYRDNRESFLEGSSNLLKNEWCSTDEYDFNSYGDLYYAGWPCIRVSEIRDVSFESRNFKDLACVDLYLEEEIGPLGRNSFREIFENRKFCVEDSDGFSVDMLEWNIGESLSSRLKELQISLCREYQYEYSPETFNEYCVT